MPDLEIHVQDTIQTQESVGGQVSKLEIVIDAIIRFLEELKQELQKRNERLDT